MLPVVMHLPLDLENVFDSWHVKVSAEFISFEVWWLKCNLKFTSEYHLLVVACPIEIPIAFLNFEKETNVENY